MILSSYSCKVTLFYTNSQTFSKKKKEKILARTRTYYVLYKIYSMYIDTIWYYGF